MKYTQPLFHDFSKNNEGSCVSLSLQDAGKYSMTEDESSMPTDPFIKVLRFYPESSLGSLSSCIIKAGIRHKIVELDECSCSQTSENADGLIILGGKMGAYEIFDYPQLQAATRWIEDAIKKEIPLLGICLGGQLIAQTLGAKVQPHHTPELGWTRIQFTEAAKRDPLLNFSPEEQYISEWHYDTFDIPQGAELLCSSDACENQAFRYGSNVYGFQFHPEVDDRLIETWLSQPMREKGLKGMGMTLDMVRQQFKAHGQSQIKWAQKFMDRFLKLVHCVS